MQCRGLTLKIMAVETKITLRYVGPAVDDHTLPIGDVIGALQGFAGAYSKVARLRNEEDVEHQLRVSAIAPSSFDLVILAWIVLGQTPNPLQTLESAYDATRWVISRIFSIMEVKKHVKNGAFDIDVRGDNNTVVVVNAEGAKLAIPPELIQLIKEKTLDNDLSKIVSPLQEKKIDTAEITAQTDNYPALQEIVKSEEREYFAPTATATTKETQLTGKFVSLNKESNRGTFELPNGKHIPYRYTGNNPDGFPMLFARRGPVRVQAIATFDENLEPTQIEVKVTDHLQGELPLESK